MKIDMKTTLRTLRREKNATQEDLANHLGITPQSVGKWERGEGYPDITLLPDIALYFDVTIDEILNFGKAQIDEKITAIKEESLRYRNAGEVEKNIALWEAAYAEFPNDCRVMNGLMRAISSRGRWPVPKEDAERIISLGERILAESTDTELREDAIQELCYTYASIGDKEAALHYADMGGSMFRTKEDMRTLVLDGEEGVKACQQVISSNILLISLTACSMMTKADFTPEEKIAAYRFGVDLFGLLYSDGNVGHAAFELSRLHSYIADEYAKLGDAEGTLAALEESTKYAVMSAHRDAAKPYTAPMVNRLVDDPAENTKNFKGNACNIRLDQLECKCFDFVREDARFKRIAEELAAHAE